MPNRRYHIHIICAANDQLLVLDRLAIFFQSRAFLTYDVSSQLPQAALYGRQCIEACDYTLVVIGETYGATHKTGVSQLHLSYLSAKAKLKPMLILIKTLPEGTLITRQLQDFTRTVEQQASHVYYYDDRTDISQLLTYAFNDLLERYSATGWVRADSSSAVAATESSTTSGITSAALPSISTTSPNRFFANKNLAAPEHRGDDAVTKPLVLSDEFNFQYNAQAYEGGNLSDVTMTLSCTWGEILQALIRIPAAFSNYGLQSCINRLIVNKAERDIKKIMPNVHAVSRCQIHQKDVIRLQKLLVAANWIQLTATGSRQAQELWKLTFHAKKLFEDNFNQS